MKSQEFQALVEQLGELSEPQRTMLMAALKSKGSPEDAITHIETLFAADPCCGHCGSKQFGTWGHANALRRYKCKGCNRTFNALTGTPLAQLHRRDAWLEYARAVVDRVSLRKASKRARVSLDTSFRWRHRFVAPAKDKRPSLLTGIVEADETLIRKSAKGSRGLVGRAPRKRGGKPKKTGTSPDDYDIVLVARDRHKATSDQILYDLEAHSFDEALDPLVARDAVLVTDGRPCYITFARERGISHVKLVALKGERVRNGFHIQNVNAYVSRLKGWMAPFRGVASKYLANYLGWRRMIERDGERLTPHHLIAQAAGA
jgi:transposase-like protein